MTEAFITFAVMALFVVAALLLFRRRSRQRHQETHEKLQDYGGDIPIPVSLHPVINPDICIGSFSCLEACPEGDILGVVNHRPVLVSPSNCIGHGNCAAECPVSAIKLVVGTKERGVDLPEVDERFESSRPGVHIVGELGGMGLIKNAMLQGLQAARYIAETIHPTRMSNAVDVLIVGSGPAGLATALGCREKGLTFRVLEQNTLGGTVAQYPRQKLVMTETVELPFVGKFGRASISKEELLTAWSHLTRHAQVRVEEGVKVLKVEGQDNRFTVHTSQGPAYARKVVLAIGRRGSPKKLGVPGEDLSNVTYRLVDARQYRRRKVLVVGGGDSALEAAIQLAEEGAKVTLSYRKDRFGRSRLANQKKVNELKGERKLSVLFKSEVSAVHEKHVEINVEGRPFKLANDYVIACIGGELPLQLLTDSGIRLKRFHEEELSAMSQATMGSAAMQGPGLSTRTLALVLGAVGLLTLAILYYVGKDYYPLALAARRASPLHARLKPAGSWGHGVGIIATLVMMSNFLYAARKRWQKLRGVGKIRDWLTFHMFVGFMAPLVIAFHAAFQSNNTLATSTAASLTVVVLTGMVGRLLYGLVPMQNGQLIELNDLHRKWGGLKAQAEALVRGARGSALHPLVRSLEDEVHARSAAREMARFHMDTVVLHLKLRRAKSAFGDAEHYLDFARTMGALNLVRVQVTFYQALKRMMSAWRVLHVALSLFLVMMITAHIALSLYLGFIPHVLP
jgi:thioredoxin reductase/NAD-dependent dihydropyrimidine dehydrogenase PreA subunit